MRTYPILRQTIADAAADDGFPGYLKWVIERGLELCTCACTKLGLYANVFRQIA